MEEKILKPGKTIIMYTDEMINLLMISSLGSLNSKQYQN